MASSSNPTGFNVIALISGGKDSLYSIPHCIKNGHKVVALANLYPPPQSQRDAPSPEKEEDVEENEDIDSFMYQTIGHSVIPLYESALGIPLYRGPITGGAVDTSRIYRHNAADQMQAYGAAAEDETESLVPLLKRIMEAHPEANAVSAGAILSTYQRTRIENVASRLGLVPLAWLWMYPVLPAPKQREELSKASPVVADAGLLEDMAACGCEARIIKVASGGLDESFLWGDVSSADGSVRRRLIKGMRRFAAEELRGAVLGEGGEYESLALDGPNFLWKQRIEVGETEVRTGEGGVGYVRLKGAKCVPKMGMQQSIAPETVPQPALLDEVFVGLLDTLHSSNYWKVNIGPEASSPTGVQNHLTICQQELRRGQTWSVSNMIAPEAGPGADAQMNAIAAKIQQVLRSAERDVANPRSTDDIVFATVLLRNMADFAVINGIYVSLFKKPNPPARVTIACGDTLPQGVHVMVSCVIDLGPRDLRQGLHVQSRSYWAPANIGPYSQAISVPMSANGRIVYVAGQIPLDPASMGIAKSSSEVEVSQLDTFSLHAVLSLQHLWRIGSTTQVDWWSGSVAFLGMNEQVGTHARIAWNIWERLHTRKSKVEEDEDEDEPQLDAWDLKYGRKVDEHSPVTERKLPNFGILNATDPSIPPFFAVQVAELPRNADIEWQSAGIRCQQLKILQEETAYGRRYESQADNTTVFTGIEIDLSQSNSGFAQRLQNVVDKHATGNWSHAVIYTPYAVPPGLWMGQIVPCRSVWGPNGRKLAAGIMLQVEGE